MKDNLPTASVIQERLSALTHAQMQALSKASEVTFTTLWKIKTGETKNPGIETVGAFLHHMEAV
jgi:hypothetical protein